EGLCSPGCPDLGSRRNSGRAQESTAASVKLAGGRWRSRARGRGGASVSEKETRLQQFLKQCGQEVVMVEQFVLGAVRRVPHRTAQIERQGGLTLEILQRLEKSAG